MNWLNIISKWYQRDVRKMIRAYIHHITTLSEQISRERTKSLLTRLVAEGGDQIILGHTPDGKPVRITLGTLCRAHSMITGGTGAGKSRAVLLICDALTRVRNSATCGGPSAGRKCRTGDRI